MDVNDYSLSLLSNDSVFFIVQRWKEVVTGHRGNKTNAFSLKMIGIEVGMGTL